MRFSPILLVLPALGCIDTQFTQASAEVAVNPSFLDMGTVVVSETTHGLLRVDSVGAGSVNVVSVTVDSAGTTDAFSLEDPFESRTLASGESLSIAVAYSPTLAGWHEADLTIQTDATTGEAAIIVHLRGRAGSPGLVISPSQIDFGSVAPGADVFADITVQSDSPVSSWLTSGELSGDAPFYLANLAPPVEVLAGATIALTIGFGAADERPASAMLNLLTDDADLGSVSIPIVANQCVGDAAIDDDRDGVSVCQGDCDDTRVDVHEGAEESLDGMDNDCDGTIDENTVAFDDDGDGYSENEGDCADADASVGPDSTETIDGVDEDCDGTVDEDTDAYDDDGDGYTELGGDCDDADARLNPGEEERANGDDDNCDGTVDEGTSSGDDDGDGYAEGAGDCDDTSAATFPGAAETADGVDEDCDGTVDEGTVAFDDDGDGYTENGGDCDDANDDIGPNQLETVGDGVDNDCNGVAQ